MIDPIALIPEPHSANDPAHKPRLLIIELDHHAEVLASLCPILAERFALVLWTTDKIWKKTGLQKPLFSSTLVMPKNDSVKRYWREHEKILRSVDLVYFNTLEKYFGFFAGLHFECPTVMRIHNANASLFPWNSIAWSITNIWPILSHLVRHVLIHRSWHYKKVLYQKMDLLMLPSSGVAARLENKANEQGFRNISRYTLPFCSLGAAPPPPHSGETIVFAVTGSVNSERKDYTVLLQAIQQLKKRQPQQKLKLILLGWAKGERAQTIIDEFLALTDTQFALDYFLDYVSQETFAETMTQVHFLVAPLKLRARHKIHLEFYGKTKISGIENDALCYRKPFILPQDYTLPTDLASAALTYNDSPTLCGAMESMIKNERWREMASRFDDLLDYQNANIAANFFRLFQYISSRNSLPAAFPN